MTIAQRPFSRSAARAGFRLVPFSITLVSGALLGGALLFQYVGGLQPCVLCLYQRWPYVATIALGLAGAALAGRLSGRGLSFLMRLCGLAFLAGAGIAGFHVGVEQGWWQGTAACGGAIGGDLSLDDLKAQLLAQPVVRCDEVPWALFGISLAGYNLLASLGLAAASAWAAQRLAGAER